ncbi:MAG: hypothetical protein KF773_25435 [Deltaproteobacteria bacterium]|nr:hypothetical protein [Deltaproteobacteria bacterium]
MRACALRPVLLLVSWTACYAPEVPDGAPCSVDDQCPAPLACHFGRCLAAAPPCVPIQTGPGTLVVPPLTSPITLDGDLADWPMCFVTVDASTAGLVRDLDGGGRFTPGRFSVATDGKRLYVAAEVATLPPLGDHLPPDVYLNNAISVYFDADGVSLTARYDPDAAQIVVDHANRSQAFASGTGLIPLSDFASAAVVNGSTFTIELSVTPATFNVPAFAPTIGFDIGLVGGNGVTMSSELVWFQRCTRPACGCTGTDSAPYCDARQFGSLTFAP